MATLPGPHHGVSMNSYITAWCIHILGNAYQESINHHDQSLCQQSFNVYTTVDSRPRVIHLVTSLSFTWPHFTNIHLPGQHKSLLKQLHVKHPYTQFSYCYKKRKGILWNILYMRQVVKSDTVNISSFVTQ